jgi:hypothetical protein
MIMMRVVVSLQKVRLILHTLAVDILRMTYARGYGSTSGHRCRVTDSKMTRLMPSSCCCSMVKVDRTEGGDAPSATIVTKQNSTALVDD